MCRKKNTVVLLIGLFWWGGALVQATEKPESEDVELKCLTLAPAAEPVPALKYRLLPKPMDQKIGNAALFYQAAAALCPNVEQDEIKEKLETWREMDVALWPLAEVEALLTKFEPAFHQVNLAAQRSRCEWEMPIEDGFNIQLPSLLQYRNMARALALRIRLLIHQKDCEAALRLLREGLALGHGVAAGATIIQDLVGISISANLLSAAEALLEMPGAPNLYWALTALPRPFIDMRPSLDYEQQMLFLEFPVLADLDASVWTPARANQEMKALLTKAAGLEMIGDISMSGVLPVAWVMMHYPDAKAFLAERGMPVDKIEALPAAQAVLVYQVRQYLEIRDSIFKWFNLPFARAYPEIVVAGEAMSKHIQERGLKANVFLMVLPALERVYFLQARLDRHVALLRTVEALRNYAAAHDNQFPESLDRLTAWPIPHDPITGQAFVYRQIDARHARLECPSSRVRKSRRPVYELILQN